MSQRREAPYSGAPDGDSRPDLTFGECEGLCGRMVERVGWDSLCFSCQEELLEEQEADNERLREEDEYLYGV